MDTRQEFTDQEIQERYANAKKTFGSCLGHSKADMNEHNRDYWHGVLKARGLEVDENVVGHFNGEGSA